MGMRRQELLEQNGHAGFVRRASAPAQTTQQRRKYTPSPNQQRSHQRDVHTQPPQADDYYSGYDMPRQASSVRHYKPTNTQAVTKITEDVQPRRRGLTVKWLLVAIALVLLAGSLLAFLFVSYAAPAIRNYSYTQTYGVPPRITKVRANTGHGTKANPDSQYIGINNGGEIEVIEIPTGTPTNDAQPHLYDIAHLTGPDAANTPITDISFVDINGDGKVDMEVEVNNTLYIRYNNGKVFTPQP